MVTNAEQRITILLNLMDDDTSGRMLSDLPPQRRESIQKQLAAMRDAPPSTRKVNEVLAEFERMFRFAVSNAPDETEEIDDSEEDEETEEPVNEVEVEDLTGLPTDDPIADLKRMSGQRLGAALSSETPRVIAILMDLLPEERAAQILEALDDEKRKATFMQIREQPRAPEIILHQLAAATVTKGLAINMDDLAGDDLDVDEKTARLLRSMDRDQRTQILEAMAETDSDAAAKLREMMFAFEDLNRIEDRCLQQLLGEVDSPTLALALHEADKEIQDRILGNLSRRARETLEEEISLLGSVAGDDRREARSTIIKAMSALDEKGELQMKE